MKSNKAKNLINEAKFQSNLSIIFRKYEEAALVAEQEAEERAVEALIYAMKYMSTMTTAQKQAVQIHFNDAIKIMQYGIYSKSTRNNF